MFEKHRCDGVPVLNSCKGDWRLLRVWANKGWSHLWGNRVLVVNLHRHLLGEGARSHRVKDIDSGSQVKAKVDSFIEGTGRPLIHSTSQGLIGSGC